MDHFDLYWIQKTNGNPMKVCLNAWLDNNNKFPRSETTTTREVDKVLEVEIKSPRF